ncbi:2-polyprenyl-6-methoxyphenol hydroxylase-like FAD-dependent oxidoreductase [Amycolatopsis bartoniae]|uniref:Hydroxylase n=1 Tax=Amycolatopsis bartoniae TaxID=941986 RepID=A0A8H9J0J3_9PSEU|nr:FAD-dependent monooxygenase [Amycolatopsis bartoniae]MBB2939456.1 2-polyprenyl-6-methoxyphenol hydroxylase-like FAD-dependent oxidoreductase [Amycolatopsis bartoniae]TVT11333.1 2-polyprenyl-6-methoxyphenol hydroxylase-like oxidoreductase [Amycolatopsis bartoniae]GHF66779.1 hydroxylase [Amycolatopsis bartoniae]
MRQGHAVVLGGGFAGLVTAGALTGFYRQVTVIDRDPAPAPDQHRRGTSHGRHAHNLLPGGALAMEEIFPGILRELATDGAVVADVLTGYRFYLAGRELPQVPIGAEAVQAAYPRYEAHLRRRLLGGDGVRLLTDTDIAGLAFDEARVTGVRIVRHEPGGEETLPADLVVDAMGRSGRTPAWLRELGYQQPEEDRVSLDVAYASRMIRLTPEGAERAGRLVGGDINSIPRSMVLLAVEGGRHVLTLTGYGPGNRPPTDERGFADFVATAAPPDLVRSVLAAEPLEAIASYRFPAAVWRRYERLHRFPDGLLVTGDALCSLNPVNGQGMTIAAMEAVALRQCLARGRHDLSRRFFSAAARLVAGPWQLGARRSAPSRTGAARLQAAVLNRVITAATRDDVVGAQFARVMGLLDPPSSLARPRVLWHVLRQGAAAQR